MAWKYRLDLPMTQARISLGRMLTSILPGTVRMVGLDSAGSPRDTLKVRVSDSSQRAFRMQPDAFKVSRMARTLGPLAISTPDTVSQVFALPLSGILPQDLDTTLDLEAERPLNGIRMIGCDSSTDSMVVRIENRSPATLSGFRLILASGGQPFADRVVGNLGPGEVRLVPVSMADARMDSAVVIRMIIRASAAQGTEIRAGAGIRVAFSLNGQKVARGQAMDTLLVFSKLYEQRFRLSDTLDLDYLQFSARMDFSIVLGSRVPLQVFAEWQDLWEGGYSESRGLARRESLANGAALDSGAYRGRLPGLVLHGGTGGAEGFSMEIQDLRTFPRSDTLEGRPTSLALVRFRFEPKPEGRLAGFDRSDSIVFIIEPKEVRFAGFDARLRYTLRRSSRDVRMPITYPWLKEQNEALRGKIAFAAVDFRLDGLMRIPQGCAIDSLAMSIVLRDEGNPAEADTLSGVADGARLRITKDLSSLLNRLPANLVLSPAIQVPSGARLSWRPHSGVAPAEDSLRMDLKSHVDLPLAWSVSEMARLVVRDSFAVDTALARAERRMDVESATLRLSIRNPTGIALELTGLGAPASERDLLFGLADSEINPDAVKSHPDSHLISLVGESPVSILPLEGAGPYSIRLGQREMESLHAQGEYYFLWRVTLRSNTEVAVDAGDSLGIAASLRVEGVASMDSLLAGRP